MSSRAQQFHALSQNPEPFDLLVIGGGATGLGVAVDAAQRGFRVALLEAQDYAKGTSSRATKLLHGGVRYLAQGNISLVREALHERTHVLRNAPEVSKPLAFVMPSYAWWQAPFYGIGLKMYDALAGSAGIGSTRFLSKTELLQRAANCKTAHLQGGVEYWDAQFDDARLALALALTAERLGAVVLNHARVTGLLHDSADGSPRVVGAQVQDALTGEPTTVRARCVINATGVWVDELRAADGAALHRPVKPMVAPSQGTHIVVDRKFWPGEHALLVPKTADGRVLFVLPWLGSVILGTTDTPRPDLPHDPAALPGEVAFILREAANYLATAPTQADIRSVWSGLRPLVKPLDEDGQGTAALSREHTVLVSKSGLLTVTGGKWTTYRAMADDVLSRAAEAKMLERRACGTAGLKLQATTGIAPQDLTATHVQHMAQLEHAITAEDVLARRCRALFLDAARAEQMADWVGECLRQTTGLDPQVAAFKALAQRYQWREGRVL